MSLPANAEEMWKHGYRFLNHDKCEICHQSIELWLNPQGRSIITNPMPNKNSSVQLHAVNCSNYKPTKEQRNEKQSEAGDSRS
jgi:hypothetical protein